MMNLRDRLAQSGDGYCGGSRLCPTKIRVPLIGGSPTKGLRFAISRGTGSTPFGSFKQET